MKRMHPSVRRFLDTEAQVDEETDDEQEEEAGRDLDDAFIEYSDDDEILEPRMANSRPLNEGDKEDRRLDDLIARVLTRGAEARERSNCDQGATSFTQEAIAYRPRDNDYPLWKVNCRVGIEETAVFSLMNTVRERHDVRSVFTRGSVRGSIYIETTMNQDLINLLKITPGIMRSQQGVHRRAIQQEDYVDILKMKNIKVDVVTGDWVVVKRGLYKGDIAYVHGTRSWGAKLLLVPRLDHAPRLERKRKASCERPPAKLFDPDAFRQAPKFAVLNCPHDYILGSLHFLDGLLEKNFDYHSFEIKVNDIPYRHFLMFKECRAGILNFSCMPRPQEWCFNENDNVIVLPKEEKARLKSAQPNYAEVEFVDNMKQGLFLYTAHIPWHNIRKDIQIGEYVQVGIGAYIGEVGWVVEAKDDFLTIAKKMVDGEIVKQDSVIECIDVLVNSVVVAEPPYQHRPASDIDIQGQMTIKKASRHPWCGLHVTVSRRYHIRKGETGQVKEVTAEQEGKAIKLTIQLTRYKPSEPFKIVTVDYNDVVESSTLKKLDDFLYPGRDAIRPLGAVDKGYLLDPIVTWDGTRFTTPPPSPPSPSHSDSGILYEGATPTHTPCWDPSSRTPTHDLLPWLPLIPLSKRSATIDTPTTDTPTAGTSTATAGMSTTEPAHILLNSKLVGVQLNVVVNGGEFSNKDLSASISFVDNHIVVRYQHYHTSILLRPEWIAPKHPSPTHDNGLLVVIQGEHCGKYVRRIHHRHRRHNRSISVVVGVVTRSEGSADILTGEQIEFEPEYLCTVPESKVQKDHNRKLMNQIRKDHQHLNR